MATRVYIETGGKRAFASAADWPGWSRAGRDEGTALAALAAYAPRYAKVVQLGRIQFPKDASNFTVVERQKGDVSTDFGVPHKPAEDEERRLTSTQVERLITLLEACWRYLDQVRAQVPEELRKGPRGGGRDRENMYRHVLDAEVEYAKAIGLRLKQPDREAFLDALRHPGPGGRWPVAYCIRRTAWHATDHAWEMEDRIL